MLTVPILTYHQVGIRRAGIQERPGLFVELGRFRRQMFLLYALGYRSISFNEFLGALEGKSSPPLKKFVLTFDDGYEGVYSTAFPVMQKYGFQGTVFLIAEDFAGQAPSAGRAFPVVTADEVNQLLRAGWQIGSHTITHPKLSESSDEQVEYEVSDSKRILEDRFGIAVKTFAYPFGIWLPNIASQVERAGYMGAVTTHFGRTHTFASRYHLRRISVGSAQRLVQFCYRFFGAREDAIRDQVKANASGTV
jgi:peptidoglycan/xylan/chitin deacetylase (PgdA/CDA1 family)